MAKRFSFVMDGRPVPWARTSTNQGRRITPKRQRDSQAVIAEAYRAQVGARVFDDEPIRLTVAFLYQLPKKPSKYIPTHDPDLSNLVKQIEDALNGVAWIDDNQIVELDARKAYGPSDQTFIYAVEYCLNAKGYDALTKLTRSSVREMARYGV